MEESPDRIVHLGLPPAVAYDSSEQAAAINVDSPLRPVDFGAFSAPTAPTAPAGAGGACFTGGVDDPSQHLEFGEADEDFWWRNHPGPHGEEGEEDEEEDEELSQPTPPSSSGPSSSKPRKLPGYAWTKATFFPHGYGAEGGLTRTSRLAACHYVCKSKTCPEGNCVGAAVRGSVQLADSDVHYVRTQFNKRLVDKDGDCYQHRMNLTQSDLSCALSNPSGVKNMGTFGCITCTLEDSRTVDLCIRSYALVVAAISYDSFTRIRADINQQRIPKPVSAPKEATQDDYARLQAWIRDHAKVVGYHDPVPGIQVGANTIGMKKESWAARWTQCCESFQEKTGMVAPGNQRLFKQAWLDLQALRNRTDIKHDKCTRCKDIQNEKDRLKGCKGTDYKKDIENVEDAEVAHKKFHSTERTDFDDACHYSVFYPEQFWTIAVDAATQSNFVIPKFPAASQSRAAHNTYGV